MEKFQFMAGFQPEQSAQAAQLEAQDRAKAPDLKSQLRERLSPHKRDQKVSTPQNRQPVFLDRLIAAAKRNPPSQIKDKEA